MILIGDEMEALTTLQYLTSREYGCCNTKELMELAKADKINSTNDVETLKTWAREEMIGREIPIK
jgi:hypothetical protein